MRTSLVAVLLWTGTAAAEPTDPSVELGGGIVVVSETSSGSSGGHFGGVFSIARWEDHLGLALEAGGHTWDGGHNTWLGADARIALLEGRKACPQNRTWSGAMARRSSSRAIGRGGDFGGSYANLGDSSRTGGWPDGTAPTPNPPVPSKCTLLGRLWFELGVAREFWQLDDGDNRGSLTRNRYSIGGGTDLGMTRFFDSIYFRVHRAHTPADAARFGFPVDQPYETSLVFGTSLTFGR